MRYGCIGKKLTHSFSKEIHSRLADYDYELIELAENEVQPFLQNKAFDAINVTIPYKETVIPHLDYISDIAKRIGAVNTVVNKEGKLYGYNTDYYGMTSLIQRLGVCLKGKKVLVLGTGGTSKTARIVANDLGAKEIITVSRKGPVDYQLAITEHSDANVIINTTPVGMYPDCESQPIDVYAFEKLEAVIDAVYNPLCTNLVLNAKKRGVKAEGGLYMLVMQAVVAVEKFLDTKIEKSVADSVFASVLASKQNVVLTGMPSSGKSTVGRLLKIDGFEFFDTDEEIEKRCKMPIKDLIASKGEEYFRDLESEVIRELSNKPCLVIATGGGAILRKENVHALKRNGKIYYIDADINRLKATSDRPLSDTDEKLKALYNQRIDIYKSTADVIVPPCDTPEAEADYVMQKRMEQIL